MTLSGISSAGSIATVLQTASRSSSTQSTASSSSTPNAPFIQKKNEDASVSRLRAAAEDYLKTLNLINQISKNSENSETSDIFEALGIGTSSSETEDGFNNAAGKLAQKVVNGTDGNDFIRGIEGGKATINAGAGNDTITARGDLTIDAGDGDDFVSVRGRAIIDGGDGNDRIIARGQSQINGGSGRDTITTSGKSVVNGGSGKDFINTQGQSIVNGGSGRDFINVHGQSTVNGGSGDDFISLHSAGTTLIFEEGSGQDNIQLYGNVEIELASNFSIDDLEFSKFGRSAQISFAGSDDKLYLSLNGDNLTATLKFADGQHRDISLAVNHEEVKQNRIDPKHIKKLGSSASSSFVDRTV